MTLQEFIESRTVYLSPFKGTIVVTTSLEEYRLVEQFYKMPHDKQSEGVITRSSAWVRRQVNNNDGVYRYLMMINPYYCDLQDHHGLMQVNSTILHEIQHVVANTQRKHGFTSPNEDEPMAYFIQQLFIAVSGIVYGACRLRLGAFNPVAHATGVLVHGLPDRYHNHADPVAITSSIINNYYQLNNNVVNYTPAGYSATTYWW